MALRRCEADNFRPGKTTVAGAEITRKLQRLYLQLHDTQIKASIIIIKDYELDKRIFYISLYNPYPMLKKQPNLDSSLLAKRGFYKPLEALLLHRLVVVGVVRWRLVEVVVGRSGEWS